MCTWKMVKQSRHQVYPTVMFMHTINHLLLVWSALRDLLRLECGLVAMIQHSATPRAVSGNSTTPIVQ